MIESIAMLLVFTGAWQIPTLKNPGDDFGVIFNLAILVVTWCIAGPLLGIAISNGLALNLWAGGLAGFIVAIIACVVAYIYIQFERRL